MFYYEKFTVWVFSESRATFIHLVTSYLGLVQEQTTFTCHMTITYSSFSLAGPQLEGNRLEGIGWCSELCVSVCCEQYLSISALLVLCQGQYQ